MVDNYKVRSKSGSSDGGLITTQAAKASRSAAATSHQADTDYGSDTGVVDVEKLTTSEASYRGMATETTLGTISTNLAYLSSEAADATNTSTNNLTGGSTFTGGFVDLAGYEAINVSVRVDQDSAASGLVISWSDDATNAIITQSFTVTASADFSELLPRRARYHKIAYTNGGVGTTSLAITTRKIPRFASVGTSNLPVIVDSELPAAAALSDALANPTTPQVGANQLVFNGTTWERQIGNKELTILASASRTTTQTGSDLTNVNAKGIILIVDVTNAGTGSITMKIQGKDPVSGAYYTVLEGAAITTNSTNVYRAYPGLTASANAVANDTLPRTFRVVITANNANAIIYSVGAIVMV